MSDNLIFAFRACRHGAVYPRNGVVIICFLSTLCIPLFTKHRRRHAVDATLHDRTS